MKDQKVIILSGGSRGLGRGIAERLLQRGHHIFTFSRNKTEFVTEMEKGPHKEHFHWEAIDGTDFDKVDQYVKSVFSSQKRIDVLINNAGIAHDGVLTLMRADNIDSMIALNLTGAIRLAQSCTKVMLQKGSGSIINISSIIGIRGYSGLSAYSATKAGLDGFTRALAREVGARGVRVNSIAPGYLETEMSSKLDTEQRGQIIRRTPLGRLGKVDDIVGPIEFLISDSAQFITGQTIVIDGGITC